MTEYTVLVSDSGVIVIDGRVKGAKLKYHGQNLNVYVKGRVSVPMRATVHYHAMSLARAHHIPLVAFFAEGWL